MHHGCWITIRCSPYRMPRDGPGDRREFQEKMYDGDGRGARDGAIPRPLPALPALPALAARPGGQAHVAVSLSWTDSLGARELKAVSWHPRGNSA
jgi:hypothetical protein